MKQVFAIGIILVLSGCQQTRSFLHMDSNSPVPFMGLELSVDNETRPQDLKLRRADGNNLAVTPVLMASHERETSLNSKSENANVESVVDLAEDAQVTVAIPSVDLRTSPGDAAEVDDIMSRIAGG